MHRIVALGVTAVVLCFSSASAQDKDWKKAVEALVDQQWPSKVMGTSGLRTVVKSEGVVLSIRQPGAVASCEATILLPETHVRKGRIVNPPSSVTPGKTLLKTGAQVYPVDLKVTDASVIFKLETQDMYSADGLQWADLTGDQRAKATKCRFAMIFDFDKGVLPTASIDTIVKAVTPVLASAMEIATASQKTIELGQTFAQVEAILGKPDTIAKLATKTIYTYKSQNLKVIFTDGKVTDVQ
jgi:hypothetical protein